MCLTPRQLEILRLAALEGMSPPDEPTAADLRLLARAGLVLEDDGGRFRSTDAGRRYLKGEDSKAGPG